MKTLLLPLILVTSLFTGCAVSYNEIGSMNLLSNKKIDENAKYKRLTHASGSTKKEIRSTHTACIDSAIAQVLNRVPNGAFLTNVKIYAVDGDYLAVSGDVWGADQDTISRSNLPVIAMNKKK